MRRHKGMIVLVAIAIALLLAVTFTVVSASEENVLIQTLGKTTRVYRGHADAGLKVMLPLVQKAVSYDARIFVFDDALGEVSTNDKQQVLVTVFCAWRISDPVKFHGAIETVEAAEQRLRELARQSKKDVIAKHRMDELINTDPKKMRLERIEQEIADAVRAEATSGYGIDVVMVGIKTLGLPEDVAAKVIDAMKAERKREIDSYEAEGEATARAIRDRAREASNLILAFADRKAAEIRSEGDRIRARYFKDFQQNPDLAVFIRELDALKTALKRNAVMILDGSLMSQIKWFREGPGENLKEKAAP